MLKNNILVKKDTLHENMDNYHKVELTKDFLKEIKESVGEAYDNWYINNKEYYYFKEMESLKAVLNELIGVEISKEMGLPTIEYSLVLEDNKLKGLLSKNFKEKDKNYIRGIYLTTEEQNYLREVLINPDMDVNPKFRRLLTLYLYRNFYTCLKDRNWNSMCIKNNDGTFDLAPIHDYESGFMYLNEMEYKDPVAHWYFNEESALYLKERNEYVKEAIEKIKSLELIKMINKIEDNYNVEVPFISKKEYLEYEKIRKKVLKSEKII